MIPQNEAKMFLARNRSITKYNWLNSWATVGANTNENGIHKPVVKLTDNVLAPGGECQIVPNECVDVVLLPLAGTMFCNVGGNKNIPVAPGTVVLFSLREKDKIEINNGYKKQFINYLELWITPSCTGTSPNLLCTSFDADLEKNNFIGLLKSNVLHQAPVSFYIGKFDGRQDALFQVLNSGNSLFAYVINGAFEIQYRLLESRDGLLLKNINTANIEALSNEAVLLLIEIKGHT